MSSDSVIHDQELAINSEKETYDELEGITINGRKIDNLKDIDGLEEPIVDIETDESEPITINGAKINNDVGHSIIDDTQMKNESNEVTEELSKPQIRKKHGLPKTIMENQKKYIDALEKQQRMINVKKDKDKNKSKMTAIGKKNVKKENVDDKKIRRVVIGGVAKMVPIGSPKQIIPDKEELVEVDSIKEEIVAVRRPAKSGEKSRRIPTKYAQQVEIDVKKQTLKNVKSFSDLRRVKAIQDINPENDVDTNRASIAELRRLKIEQRKRDFEENKKKAETNKRENAIQEILKNDKMSKFAKTVAIHNLSVSSRNRKINKPSVIIEDSKN